MNSTSFKSSDVQTGAAHMADAVGDLSKHAGEQVSNMVHGAADSIRTASNYVRDNAGEVGTQIKSYLKANPTHAVIGAAILGFVVGRLMSSRK